MCVALLFSTSEIWAQGRPPAPGRGGAPVEQQGRGGRSSDENTERRGDWRGRGRGEQSERGDQGSGQTGEENGRGRGAGRGDRGGEESRQEAGGRERWSGRGGSGRGDSGRGDSGRGESGRGESGRGESRGGRGREGGERGTERGTERGERESSRERGRSRRPVAGDLREQVLNQLVALDLNQNGQLEPAEANSLSSTIMRQLGLDPGRPIYLDTLRSLVNQVDLTTIPFETDAGLQAEGERSSFEFPSVSNRRRGRGEDMGFAATDNPILSDPTPMEERYSPLVLEEVRSLLARYDANNNGVLDPAEIEAVPWATANPLESDLDQDGRLSDIELAERMKSFGSGEQSGSGRSGRSRTRRTEGQTEDDPRAVARAAAEAERERRAEERKQRERERRNSGPTDRVASYVKELIGKLDTDNDGSLTIEEVSTMRNPPPKSADADGDGILTYAELYAYYGDGQSPSGSSSSRSGSRSTASDRGPLTGTIRWDGDLGPGAEDEGAEWPAELARKDRNNDRMISLAEFSANLSAAEREAFAAWDRNGDGFITLSEAQQPGGSRAASTRSSSSRGERETSSSDRSRSSSSRRGGTENASESSSPARRSFGRSRGAGEADAAGSDRGSTSNRTSDRSGDARRSGSAPRSTEANRDARGNASERGGEQAPPANALRYSIFGN